MLMNYPKIAPEAIKALSQLNTYSDTCSVDQALRRLVEIIVSRINGCHYCIMVHEKQAKALGESDARVKALKDWQKSTLFSDAEKCAFERAVIVTHTVADQSRDDNLRALSVYFSDQQIVDLTFVISAMNVWNRMAISFGHET